MQPIFPGTDRQGLLHAILHDEPRPLKSLDRTIPAELETIVLKAVSKSADDRYATAGDMAADLRRFLEDRPIAARRPSGIDRARKWLRRHPAYFRAALVFLVFSVLVLAGTTAAVAREQRRTKEAFEREKLRAEEAEDRFRLARRSADEMIRIANEELGDNPPMQAVRKRLLETALALYREFMEQRRDDPTAQAELDQTRDRVKSILSDLAVIQGAWKHLLLKEPSVQDDLRLDERQRDEIGRITQDIGPRGDFLKMTRAQRDGKIIGDMRRHDAEIAAVLTAAQRTRFEQIALQSRGVLAFREPAVVESLKLTDDQRERLHSLEGDPGPPPGDGFHGEHRPGPGRGYGPHGSMDKALAVLTSEQRTRWQASIGPRFNGFRGDGHRQSGPPRGGPKDRGPGPGE